MDQKTRPSDEPLNDPSKSPLGKGTHLTYLWHSQILPSPEHKGENPYLSDAAGNLMSGQGGTTTYMTYKLLMLNTAVTAPESWDADATSGHEYYAANKERSRFVAGLGQLVVEFEIGPGNHRVPKRIVSGGVDESTFGVLNISGSQPGPGNRRVLRGIEPTMTRDGNLLIWQTNLTFGYSPLPSGPSPGFGHLVFSVRLQGNYADPSCTLNSAGCLPLRFSPPLPISSMYLDKDVTIPGQYVTFGMKYPLFRHKLGSPLGEHIYQAGEPYGGAYPWVDLEGKFLIATTGHGIGDYLDFNATSQVVQRNGGLEYCLFSDNCLYSPAPPTVPNIRREGYAIVGNSLVSSNGAESFFQPMIFDNPLNEGRRTLARVMGGSFGIYGDIWGPSQRLPVNHMSNFKVTPGDNVFPVYVHMNNANEAVGYVGRAEGSTMGQVSLEAPRQGFLFYSGLAATGAWLPDSVYDPTRIQTIFTRAQDVSGNNLKIQMNFNPSGGGAFYPYNDPVGVYNSPLRDNERQLAIGRVGEAVYCSTDGKIFVTEDPATSRTGTLSNFSDKLSVQFWYKPMLGGANFILAQSPAYTVEQTNQNRIRVTVRASKLPNSDSFVSYTSETSTPVEMNSWYQISASVSFSLESKRMKIVLNVNNQKQLDVQSIPIVTITTLHKKGEWFLCPGGNGMQANRAMVMDEIGISARPLDTKETRVASLIRDPELSRVTNEQRALLGPLALMIDSLGFDVNETFVACN